VEDRDVDDSLARFHLLAEYVEKTRTQSSMLKTMVVATQTSSCSVDKLPPSSTMAIQHADAKPESLMERLLVDILAGRTSA
jgi:hypothetical protein